MSSADAPARAGHVAGYRRRPASVIVFAALISLLIVVMLLAATIGAAGIPLSRLWPALGLGGATDPATFARDQLVLWSIRIPRIVVAAMIGALLAMAGTIMQGLFRNPLADPALVGVSSGGAFAAAFTIVVLDTVVAPNAAANAAQALPLAAFAGSLITTLLLYRISSRDGRTSVAMFTLFAAAYFGETGSSPQDLRAALIDGETDALKTVLDRAVTRGEIDAQRLVPPVATLPYDLFRLHAIMTFAAPPPELRQTWVDSVFLPLVRPAVRGASDPAGEAGGSCGTG